MGDAGCDDLLTGFKALVARGKNRGFVTYDDFNRVLPEHLVSLEQREDSVGLLLELGISIIEAEDGNGEDGDPVGGGPCSPQGHPPLQGGAAFEALDNDPGAAVPAEPDLGREQARAPLHQRLAGQTVTDVGSWRRNDLYER